MARTILSQADYTASRRFWLEAAAHFRRWAAEPEEFKQMIRDTSYPRGEGGPSWTDHDAQRHMANIRRQYYRTRR